MDNMAEILSAAVNPDEKYGEVIDILTKKMKELGEESTSSVDEQAKICAAMKDVAISMAIIVKMSAGNAAINEITKQLCGL